MASTYAEHVEELSNRLSADIPTLEESQRYRDADYRLETLGIGAPPEMEYLRVNMGWPAVYLGAIEDRLDVEGFRVAGTSDNIDLLWQWWQDNDLDEESSLGHMDALTFRQSYITVAAPGEDDDNYPIIRLESPLWMRAETDPRTRKITRAVRLYKTTNDTAVPDQATLYLPDRTVFLRRNGGMASDWVLDGPEVVHGLGTVPVVPLTNKANLANRYGQSEITPTLRSLTDAASRSLMNLQAASELLAVPLRVFFGVDKTQLVGEDGQATVNDVYYGRILALQNEAGKAFEFSAADLRNFVEEMSELAKQVASETGLPPQYLSFSSDNPASADAILASEARLIKKCERKARLFGGSWEKTMRLAMQVMGKPVPEEYRRLETVWRDPSTPTYAAKADAAFKLYSNGSGPVPKEQIRIDLGYTDTQREQQREWDRQEMQDMMGAYAKQVKIDAANTPKPTPDKSESAA